MKLFSGKKKVVREHPNYFRKNVKMMFDSSDLFLLARHLNTAKNVLEQQIKEGDWEDEEYQEELQDLENELQQLNQMRIRIDEELYKD